MKQHYCPAEKTMMEYEDECNWCGEKEIKDVVEQFAWECRNAQDFDYKKFADLILFECIKLAVFRGDKETAAAIKEHFRI